MQIASSPTLAVGAEYSNTQVTSLVVGQLYAHLFSSTAWKDFPGYAGIELEKFAGFVFVSEGRVDQIAHGYFP
jgi:hypothetical protein